MSKNKKNIGRKLIEIKFWTFERDLLKLDFILTVPDKHLGYLTIFERDLIIKSVNYGR